MSKLNIKNGYAYYLFDSIAETECETRKIQYEFESDTPIGSGKIYSSKALKPIRISLGSKGLDKSDTAMADFTFIQGVVAVFHELRHVDQLLLNDKPEVNDDERYMIESQIAVTNNHEFYKSHYTIDPNEIDAERNGIKKAHGYVSNLFKGELLQEDIDAVFVEYVNTKKNASCKIKPTDKIKPVYFVDKGCNTNTMSQIFEEFNKAFEESKGKPLNDEYLDDILYEPKKNEHYKNYDEISELATKSKKFRKALFENSYNFRYSIRLICDAEILLHNEHSKEPIDFGPVAADCDIYEDFGIRSHNVHKKVSKERDKRIEHEERLDESLLPPELDSPQEDNQFY